MSHIAVFDRFGDSQDYAISDEALRELIDSKQIWKSPRDTNTGDSYGEEDSREMYSCDALPLETEGIKKLED